MVLNDGLLLEQGLLEDFSRRSAELFSMFEVRGNLEGRGRKSSFKFRFLAKGNERLNLKQKKQTGVPQASAPNHSDTVEECANHRAIGLAFPCLLICKEKKQRKRPLEAFLGQNKQSAYKKKNQRHPTEKK